MRRVYVYVLHGLFIYLVVFNVFDFLMITKNRPPDDLCFSYLFNLIKYINHSKTLIGHGLTDTNN